jgi:uncharacterized protein (TIGR00725 family)
VRAATTYVAVVGPGDSDADDASTRAAEEVGRLLASAGAVVLCGGLGGVMGAVARGVRGGGGTCVGLLPDGDRARADPALTLALATGLGELRNGILVTAADAVIAVGGSWGTLSEVAFALRLGKPVVGLLGWSVSDAAGVPLAAYQVADTPTEAVAAALATGAAKSQE